MNSAFEQWLKMELGVTQRFSNIEHPWENGKAERSFQTLFALSRSLLKHADLPDRLWGKAILHSVYITNRIPTAALGGIAPLQFRTRETIDLSHMRVFGSPAQIFVRATIRNDKKLSDRSVSGTFVGISDKGNGYIFLIRKLDMLVEIDSKDENFNETFSDCRAQQGKLSSANNVAPDLHNENQVDNDENDNDISRRNEDNGDNGHEQQHDEDDNDPRIKRPRRQTTPRKFLLPGTYSKKELDIRRMEDANICLDSSMDANDPIFLLNCMEAQTNDESKLLKEMELLNVCTYDDEENDILLSALAHELILQT